MHQTPSLEDIFFSALEKPSEQERGAYLASACAGHPELRRQVEKMLAAQCLAGSFLEHPASHTVQSPDDWRDSETAGTVIGPYKLLEKLGEGGFGVVFHAEQTDPVRRRVALKVLKAGMDSRPIAARFEAERQALAIMDHPNIARIFDGGETASGRPYFVMELVRGIPVTEYCDRQQLTPTQRLKLFLQVCDAVQHAHQKSVIHRDLKPSNILVSRHDTTPVVKVIDFGVAKALGQNLTDKTLFTGAAQMIGTPLYMSPEQAGMSDLDVDTRSDIYSLGVLLYELLTGTTPFEKERLKSADFDEIRRIVREEDPPMPSARLSTLGQAASTASTNRGVDLRKLTAQLRGDLDWIAMKALEKDRSRRYATVGEFAADVERFLANEPVHARPPSWSYRGRKFARRNKAALAVAALVAVTFAVAAGSIGYVLRDRSNRLEKVEQSVEIALSQMDEHQRREQWPDALESVRRADAIRADHVIRPELHARIEENQAWLNFILRLEDIRLDRANVEKDGHFNSEWADREFTGAFQDVGIDLKAIKPEELRERIPPAFHAAVIDALTDWELYRLDTRRTVLEAALAMQPDEQFNRFLNAVWKRDRKALIALAQETATTDWRPGRQIALSQAVWGIGDRERAIAILRRAQQSHPNDFWVNHNLAMKFMQLQPPQLDEAIRYFTAAVALRPLSPGVHNNLALALREQGDLDGAIASFDKALRLKQDYVQGLRNLAETLSRKGDYPRAAVEWSKLIRDHPEEPAFRVRLAECLRHQMDLTASAAEIREALRLDPNSSEAWTVFSGVALESQDWNGAAAAAMEALRLQAENPEAYCNLGHALLKMDAIHDALRAFRFGHALGSKKLVGKFPSEVWRKDCEHFVLASQFAYWRFFGIDDRFGIVLTHWKVGSDNFTPLAEDSPMSRRKWLDVLFARHGKPEAPRPRLGVQQLEDRTVPTGLLSGFAFGNDTGLSMAVHNTLDSAGNSYVSGMFTRTVDFEPADPQDAADTLTAQGIDGYVAKYAPDNSLVWVRSITGPSGAFQISDPARKVAVDANGNVYVTGAFTQTAQIGSITLTSAGNADGYLVKFSPTGEVLWAKRWGGTGQDESRGLGVDASGKVYVVTSRDTVNNLDNWNGINVLKFNSDGVQTWSKLVNVRARTLSAGLAVTADGNLFIAAKFNGTVDFDPGSKVKAVSSGSTDAAFVMKLDSAGNFGWVSPFVGTNINGVQGTSSAVEVAVDAGNNVVVTGHYNGTVDFNPGGGTATLPPDGGAFIVKLNSKGTLTWAQGLVKSGTTVNPVPSGLALDSTGSIYICGSFTGTVDFDPGSGTVSRTAVSSNGNSDAYLLKLNSAGNHVWVETFGAANGHARGHSVAVDSSGTIYFVGHFNKTIDFDPNPDVAFDLSSMGTGQSVFFIKLSQ